MALVLLDTLAEVLLRPVYCLLSFGQLFNIINLTSTAKNILKMFWKCELTFSFVKGIIFKSKSFFKKLL